MLRSVLVDALDSRPDTVRLIRRPGSGCDTSISPYSVPEGLQLLDIARVEGELLCWLDEHSVLELASSEHDRALHDWVGVDDLLYSGV